MTFVQLLQDDTYRAEMMKALEAEKVQTLTPQETRTTQALKAYIKLKGTPLPVLLDTGASISAISKDLAQKLQLKVKANDEIRVLPLGGNPKVKVIGLVREAPLSVQHIRTPGTLYVVEGTEIILILGTDWFDRYQADIRRSDNKIEITHQGEKAQLNLLFKKNNDDGYEYLFSLREEEPDQWFDVSGEGLAGSSNILTWREPERPSQLLKKIYKLENMVEDAIQQGLMFDVPEEHWELLEECDGMLATREEKICNLISDPIEGQRKAQVIPPNIQKVLDKYPEVISKGDWDISNCNLVEHEIHLEHDRSIKNPIRYINLRLADWLKSELQKIEEIGIIQKSCSPYTSPITIVEVLRSDSK